jgi:hypothetical protein
MTLDQFDHLSDDALIAETKRAADHERRSMADLLALLIEVERRRLHLALGHSSLFVYCVRVLHLSEQSAYSRITAARTARRYPQILPLLAHGALTLSSIGLLAPHLTDETVEPVLEAARFKSTREVEQLIGNLHPQPDIEPSLRAMPTPAAPAPGPVSPPTATLTGTVETPAASRSIERHRSVLAPLAPRRYYLKLTIGQDTHDTLERLRALLRHSVPDGDLAAIVDRALKLLLRETEQTKSVTTPKARASTTVKANVGRHIPAAVRRAVWTRDAGRCAFEGQDGRCNESAFLEFHHVLPFADGGETTIENLELRCRAHNAYEAALLFGPWP